MNTNVCSRPRPSGKEWSPKAGETERRHRLGGASYLKGVRSRLLDQQLKRNCSVLSQRGQTRKPNRLGRKTAFYGSLLHKKREGGKARVNRRAPSQICTATPSGVVTYGALGHVPPHVLQTVYFAAAASLIVKISKITKEEHVIHFRISPQKHAETVLEPNINPGQGRRGKICRAPLTSFPGDATGHTLYYIEALLVGFPI